MKKKHPFLYVVLRRAIILILLLLMILTAYHQSTGQLVSPEGIFTGIITPFQGVASKATQLISDYLYRVKRRSNIEYEYNQLKAQAHHEEQLLLAPVVVTVSREEHTALLDAVEELQTAGITIEDFGGQSVLVRSFPLDLTGEDIDNTLREIATGLVGGNREIQTAKLDWIYHSSACRAAIKAGDSSKPVELQELAKRVLTDDSIRFCPHGRPVCIEMTKKELEKQFGRIL